MREIRTLGKDRKTVNVFMVPNHVTLDVAINKQGRAEFRALYLVSSHQITI